MSKSQRNMAKKMIAYVSEIYFLEAMRGGFKVTNFPKDAILTRAGYNIERQGFYIVLQSETFKEAKEGEILPLFMLECRR